MRERERGGLPAQSSPANDRGSSLRLATYVGE